MTETIHQLREPCPQCGAPVTSTRPVAMVQDRETGMLVETFAPECAYVGDIATIEAHDGSFRCWRTLLVGASHV